MKNLFVLLISVMLIGCEDPIETVIIDMPIDIDGNEYTTVVIGDQEWFMDDLRTIHFNNGSAIEYISNSSEWVNAKGPAYCLYNGIILYNYYCIETGLLAPKGWHIPSDEEWKALEIHLGMDSAEANDLNWRGDGIVDALLSTNYCVSYSNGRNGYYGDYIDGSYWWTSSIDYDNNAYFRSVVDGYNSIYRGVVSINSGFSVRCIRNQ